MGRINVTSRIFAEPEGSNGACIGIVDRARWQFDGPPVSRGLRLRGCSFLLQCAAATLTSRFVVYPCISPFFGPPLGRVPSLTILAEGAIALSVTLSGGALFAS